METLLQYINHYVHLGEEARLALLNSFKTKPYANGEVLLQKGETCQKLYFILSGTARTYFYQEGKDITTWIYPESHFITSWASFIWGQPSYEFIEVGRGQRGGFYYQAHPLPVV